MFTTVDATNLTVYAVVFLTMVAVWCFAGHSFATHPIVARLLSRWGHLLLPLVLIGIGAAILIQGAATPATGSGSPRSPSAGSATSD